MKCACLAKPGAFAAYFYAVSARRQNKKSCLAARF